MARETFEGQAAAVRNALRGKLTPSDREQLEFASKTLDHLAALRHKCLEGPVEDMDEEFSDELSAEIIKLLRLPTDT